MKIIRVFPRKTSATPDDENVRFGPPGLFDEADEVCVSVTWTWDIPKAEKLAEAWKFVTHNTKIGGPAYNDQGGEFEPGRYVKNGYVFTSRGCPNHCWFCFVPKREGSIRELQIKDGFNILDSNLLACSDEHIKAVFSMLGKQKERPRFTGGLEAKLMKPWIAESIVKLKPKTAYFAYDTSDDYEPLVSAVKLMGQYETGNLYEWLLCYVLIGWDNDTLEKAEKRLNQVIDLGIPPMAMLYNRRDDREWRKLQREYANKTIVYSKIRRKI